MSKKLSDEESVESVSAISRYRINNSGAGMKNVVVTKNGKKIFEGKIGVTTIKHNIYYEVDIIWEDAGFDYKKHGLFGYYSSTYNKITYDNIVLKIYSDDIVISII